MIRPVTRRAAYVAAAVCTAAVAACAPAQTGQDDGTGPAPPGLERFYAQHLDWGACDAFATTTTDAEIYADPALQCARLEVPLDYAAPEGRTAQIAVLRHATDRRKVGSLVINPGGPGGSGTETAADLSRQLRRRPVRRRRVRSARHRREHPEAGLPDARRRRSSARRSRRRPVAGRGRGGRAGDPGLRREVRRALRRGGRAGQRRHPRRRPGHGRAARRAGRPQADLPRLLLRHLHRLDLRRDVPRQRARHGARRRRGPGRAQRRRGRGPDGRVPARVRGVRGGLREEPRPARWGRTRPPRPPPSRRWPARWSAHPSRPDRAAPCRSTTPSPP